MGLESPTLTDSAGVGKALHYGLMPALDPWSTSRNRTMQGGRADRAELPRGANGRILCRWCNLETPPGRVTFCSDWCVHEWRLRTDAGYLRDQVFLRDRGICAICRADSGAAYVELKRSR